jgi:ribulose-phosphate 3-epimerase
MAEIIPAILPASFEDLTEKVNIVSKFAARVQVDVVDGKFAKSRTWPFVNDRGEFAKLTAESEGLPSWEYVSYEIDMMVENPASIFDNWVVAGASALIVHRESVTDPELEALIAKATERDVELGLALKPSTPIEQILPFADRVAFIQCMGNDHIGEQGVALDESVYDTLKALREKLPNGILSVDIGVNEDTASELINAGANKLVSGSAIFEADSPKEAFEFFKSL